ncbi:MAG: hypothetical protein IPJ81_10550 [Chitinophagaceae bacterium]|nr:hypothetical protein [Chitinophagaceae bacterium]
MVSNSSDSYGNFLTILSTNVSDKNGCKRFVYGVGFGKDKESSLKTAETRLKSNVWNGGAKFTYKIVKQEMIGGTSTDGTSEEETSDGKPSNKNEGMDKLKRKS